MIKNPHNNLFVSSFSDPEVLAEFLSLNLDPKLLKYMDLKKISRINESYIDEELKHSQSDLVFEVNLDNDPGYLYLALEHQSTPDHLMAFRFVKYMCRIWDDYVQKNPKTKKLPVIIPILFSQCDSQWKISTELKDIFFSEQLVQENRESILNLKYQLKDVHDIDSQQLLGNSMSAAILKIMQLAKAQDFQNCLDEFVQLIKILHFRDKMDLIRTLLTYSFAVSEDLEPQELSAIISEQVDKETGEKIMSVAERLFKDGERKGFAEGEARGKAEGEARGKAEGRTKTLQETLLRMIKKRFPTETTVQNSILAIQDSEALEQLIDTFLESAKLADFKIKLAQLV